MSGAHEGPTHEPLHATPDEDGVITVMVVVLAIAVVAAAGLVIDGGRVLAARRDATNVAAAAARTAAQELDVSRFETNNSVQLIRDDACGRPGNPHPPGLRPSRHHHHHDRSDRPRRNPRRRATHSSCVSPASAPEPSPAPRPPNSPNSSAETKATTMTATAIQRNRRHPARAFRVLLEAEAALVGFPTFLAKAAGWPLPHGMPTWTEVQRAYQIRYVPDRLIIGGLACVGWVCWALMMISVIGGAFARARETEFRRPVLMPAAVHRLARRWIGAGALIATLATRPAVASVMPATTAIAQVTRVVDTQTREPFDTPPTTLVKRAAPDPSTTRGRTYVTGANETYWDVAEATLGDGTRWREILEANPVLGSVDLVPSGTTLNIPGDTNEVTVVKGDNLWKLAATELKGAHGQRPSNAEIVPYWREVIETNVDELRSGDPDLIYTGETIELPRIDGDLRTEAAVADTTEAPPDLIPNDVPVTTTPTTALAAQPPVTTKPFVVASTPSMEVVDEPDDYEPFEIPWLKGLAITGVAGSVILGAWHRQRRRRIWAHRPGDPMPTLTDNDRDLISQLRGIAEDDRLAAIDTALRLLVAGAAEGESMPGVTIARAGRHSVELLLDKHDGPTPKHFLRLDNHTIVVNPGLPDDIIGGAIIGQVNPSPAMVVLGTDDIGSLLVDLEKTAALAIEAETTREAEAIVTALLTQLASQPWSADNAVHTIGTAATIDPEARTTRHEESDALIAAAEAHLQAQPDEVITSGTHAARVASNRSIPVLIAVLGVGHGATARVLADAARQQGSALAVVSVDAIPNSAWRLVVVDGRATLEPAGLTVENKHFLVSKIDDESNDRLIETFGAPTPEPVPVLKTEAETSIDQDEVDDDGDDQHTYEYDGPGRREIEATVAEIEPEQPVTVADFSEPASVDNGSGNFDQLVLLREPVGERLPAGLTVAEQIDAIMKRKEIELVLLDGPPRLEGVCWDPKKAARADEIIAFITVNGPSTLRQVALALWPDHPRPDKTASQQISRARHLLGEDADGRPRLSVGNRATPYVIHDVGCDWHRFLQLSELVDTRDDDHESGMLLRAALSLVRTAPFESARSKAFAWAADQCFDSRMRLEIANAAQQLENIDSVNASLLASSKRLLATG